MDVVRTANSQRLSAMHSKTRKWCFAVVCECGKFNVITTAPSLRMKCLPCNFPLVKFFAVVARGPSIERKKSGGFVSRDAGERFAQPPTLDFLSLVGRLD
jgi:hypothetical protein